MDVLIYLAAHPGRVVPKEELMDAVWEATFVEEGALSQAVHSLRKALGDDARHPSYLQTLPKRGYRLLAPVLLPEAPGKEPPEAEPAAETPLSTLATMDPARLGGRGWPVLLAAAAAFGAAVVLWIGWARLSADRHPPPHSMAEEAGTRIVVLPFKSLGKPEDGYFADGLTEEITKDLASLPALQVISRTSALRYQGDPKRLSDVGRELRVQYALEGTVLWAPGTGDRPRVRINAQLVRVEDDVQVWAESFEREVEDIFEVQAEISRRVIGRLGIALLPEQERELRPAPTENLEAYQAYLRGLKLRSQPFYSEKHVQMAMKMFERAVELDPGFADAWAELSQTHSYLVFNSNPAGRVTEAQRALDQALALAPDLPSARLAQAYFTYRCLRDFDGAQEQLAAAARLSPNDAEVLQTLGFVLRRQGHLAEAIELLQRAFSLDPHMVKLVWAIAETYRALRDYEQADRYYSQAIAMAPDQAYYWEEKTLTRLAWTGDLDDARAVLENAPVRGQPGLLPIEFQLDFYGREYEWALERLSPERMQDLLPADWSRLVVLGAIARERLGDHQGALAAAEANRVALEARVARLPKNAHQRAYLAVTLAQLGREAEALAQIEQAVRLYQNDAFTGPRIVQIQALVETILGRHRQAVSRLARLLDRRYQAPLSVADLRLDPVWDPLRGDPAFEELLRRFDD